jgi:acyl-coenzyme A thioesterase 9
VDHKTLSFKARVKPENQVWMEDAKLKNVVICQPEYRNRFNKVAQVAQAYAKQGDQMLF